MSGEGQDGKPAVPVVTISEPTAEEVALFEATEKLLAELEDRSRAGLTAIAGQLATVASLFGFFALLPKETTTRVVLSWPFWVTVAAIIISFCAAYVGLWGSNQTAIPPPSDPVAVKAFWKKRLGWRRAWQRIALGSLLVGVVFFGLAAGIGQVSDTRASVVVAPTAETDAGPASVKATVTVTGLSANDRVLVCMEAPIAVNTSLLSSDGSADVTGLVPRGTTEVIVKAWLVDADAESDCAERPDSESDVSPLASASVTLEGPKPDEPNALTVSLSATASSRRSVTVDADVAGLSVGEAATICTFDGKALLAQTLATSNGARTLTTFVPRSATVVTAVAYPAVPASDRCAGDMLAKASVTVR